MKKSMKKRLIALAACLCMIAGLLAACGDSGQATTAKGTDTTAGGAADGKVYTLTVSQSDPETSATGRFLNAWAERVEEASDGRIKINIYHGATIAGPKDTVDAVKNGLVDIGWGLQSLYDGVFPVTEAMMLPLMGIESAPHGTRTFWKFWNETDYMKDEYKDYHVLYLHTNCQSPIMLSSKSSVKKIENISDFAGLNIRANSGPPNMFVAELGATPVGCAINDLYKNLETAEMDGCTAGWDAISSFKLDEVVGSYMDEDINVYTYFLLMNPASYEALPEDLQKILDETTATCDDLTVEWDIVQDDIKTKVADKLYKLSDTARADLEAAADRTVEKWSAQHENGEEIVAKLKECIEATR